MCETSIIAHLLLIWNIISIHNSGHLNAYKILFYLFFAFFGLLEQKQSKVEKIEIESKNSVYKSIEKIFQINRKETTEQPYTAYTY